MIEYLLTHPVQFFFILLAQYCLIAPFQQQLKRSSIGKPIFIWFIWQDWLINVTWFTVWCLDPPQRWNEVVTKRMRTYKTEYVLPSWRTKRIEQWRYFIAVNLCRVLSVFDKGHC
jgi:hypothetical protein